MRKRIAKFSYRFRDRVTLDLSLSRARGEGKGFTSFMTKQKTNAATGRRRQIMWCISRSLSALNLQFSVSGTTSVGRRATFQIVDEIP